MLTAKIQVGASSDPRFVRTRDAIATFPSAFIETIHVEDEHHARVFVSELGGLSSNEGVPYWIGGFDRCDRQGIELSFGKNDPYVLTIRRTGVPGVPIYVSLQDRTLVVSWRFEDAVGNLEDPLPDIAAARIYVENGPALTRETVIAGVFMLWPGETLVVTEAGLVFTPQSTRDVVVPATLSWSARATDGLREIIAENLRPFLEAARTPIVELSGGFDSSCVALAASDVREGLMSYGLVHGGVVGVQQRARRREIVDLLRLTDHEYLADNHLQLAALEITEAQITPFDDNQRIPCAYGVETHPSGTADLILTGVGGDELCMEQTFRRASWELPGTASSSSLTVAAGRADMFLRKGIWPLNPLCSPTVIDFCRALPRSLRINRSINLLMLARAGLSDGFLFPKFEEGYGHAMQREAALYDFDAALDSSLVADFGVMDISPLLEKARAASSGGFSYELICSLFWLLKLEKVLKRYVK